MKNVTYINAGAGSGKTYRLTETLTNLIKSEKVKPEQVILTTFTTKAANEFKEKAKAFLYDEGLYDAAIQFGSCYDWHCPQCMSTHDWQILVPSRTVA